MKSRYCPNCRRVTGFKRALGWGTLFGSVVTGGWSLATIPAYPLRCIVCGTKWDDAFAEALPSPSFVYTPSHILFTKCHNCNATVDKLLNRCPRCGVEIGEIPSSATVTPPPTEEKLSPAETRLQELKNLFDKGLITSEEYERKRGNILQEL